jgi:hypothetical protein
MLKHCAANRKRRLSALPNVVPYIYIYTHDIKFFGFTRISIHTYDISRLRVKPLWNLVNFTYHTIINLQMQLLGLTCTMCIWYYHTLYCPALMSSGISIHWTARHIHPYVGDKSLNSGKAGSSKPPKAKITHYTHVKIQIFWDVMPCWWVNSNWCFRGP